MLIYHDVYFLCYILFIYRECEAYILFILYYLFIIYLLFIYVVKLNLLIKKPSHISFNVEYITI